MLSFLSSDATASPADIIPHLRLDDQKLKGMHMGRWRVEDSLSRDKDGGKSIAEQDRETCLTTEGPMVIVDGLLDVGSGLGVAGAQGVTPKYSFGMKLGLRSRPIGRCVLSYKCLWCI